MSYWSLVNSADSAYAVPGQVDTPNDYLAARNASWQGGSAAYEDGVYGRAFAFNNSRYLTATDPLNGAGAVSLFSRVKLPVDAAGNQGIIDTEFGANPTVRISLLFTGRIFGFWTGSGTSQNQGASSNFPVSTWASCAYVCDGSTLSIYQNNSQVGSRSVTGTLAAGASTIAIGASVGGGNNVNAGGAIAEATLFRRALSTPELTELHAGPEPTNTTAPVASLSGGVLSCTTGVWDSYGNGTATYTYQWQSYSGSWSNVSGATSSSYTPSGSGTYRCVVAATNNGGNDSASDTASNEVTYTAGGMSCNELLAAADIYAPLDDALGSTVVANTNGADGVLIGAGNTSASSVVAGGSSSGGYSLAIDFDGTNDYIRFDKPAGWTAYPVSMGAWIKLDSTAGTMSGFSLGNSSALDQHLGVQDRANNWSVIARNTLFRGAEATGSSDTNWHFVSATWASATSHKLYIDGVQLATNTTSVAWASGYDQIILGLLRTLTPIEHLDGQMAGFVADAVAWSDAEHAELAAGREPENTTAPTLDAAGNWSVGSWNAYSNGTATYTVTLLKDAVEVATIQTVSATSSGNVLSTMAANGAGEYSILVAATNNGGNDPASDTASNEVTFTAGSPDPRFQASFQPSFAA